MNPGLQAVAAVTTAAYLAFSTWAVFVDLRRRLPWPGKGYALAAFIGLFVIPPAGVGLWWTLRSRLDTSGEDRKC